MKQVDGRWAYTLTEAATELNVTKQWVGQLLKKDTATDTRALDGPPAPSSGGKYSARGAPRVWKDSVDAYLANNAQGKAKVRGPSSGDQMAADLMVLRRWTDGQERRLRASAQELKVTADHLREQLREERRHRRSEKRHLLQMVIESAAAVRSLANDIVRNDDIDHEALQHYSDALTQLLAFDLDDFPDQDER